MKKFRNIIIFSILFIFLVTCSISILIATKPITFDELIEESDCCVRVYLKNLDGSLATSKKIGKNYYIDMRVFRNGERDLNVLEEKITIIQENEPYLETYKLDEIPGYILFLTKADTENTYYVTGGKSGVIRTDYTHLYAIDDNLQQELNEYFTDVFVFEEWRKNIYNFSADMISEANKDSTTHEYAIPLPETTFSWDILSPSYSESYTTLLETTTAPADNN